MRGGHRGRRYGPLTGTRGSQGPSVWPLRAKWPITLDVIRVGKGLRSIATPRPRADCVRKPERRGAIHLCWH